MACGFLLLSVALVASVWVVPYLPTNDGPEAILAVHIENHYGDPGTIYRDVFLPAPQFAGRGFTILYEPLEDLFGWQRGLQVALSILLLTNAWGMVALTAALDLRRLPLAFLGFPLALSWCFYMGFFPFVFASGVGLFVLAYALRVARLPSWPRRTSLAALLLLEAFMHVFAAFLTGGAVLVVLVAAAPKGKRVLELGKVALLGLPAAGLAFLGYWVAERSLTSSPALSTFFFASLHDMVAAWPRTLAPGGRPRALVWCVVVVLAAAVAVRRVARAGEGSLVERALSGLAVVYLVASFAGPPVVPGWQFFSERFVALGALVAIACVPIERVGERRSRLWPALLFVGAGASIALSFPFHKRLEGAWDDVVAGLSANVHRKGVFLPVTLEPWGSVAVPLGDADVPYYAPLRHVGALYATAQGGLIPYTFANNGATWAFTIRPDSIHPPPVPPRNMFDAEMHEPEFETNLAFRRGLENDLASYGMYYEGVLLTGLRPADVALWKERGFVADWERGTVLQAHFEPCRVDVLLSGDEPAPRVDVGVGESTMVKDRAPRERVDREGRRHLLVDGTPCGAAWVRPHWDAADVPTYCGNAGASGEIAVVIGRAGARVECGPAR